MKRPFHHWLLAVYPVLVLYSINADQTPWSTAAWPMAMVLAAAAAGYFGVSVLLKDRWKASLLVTLFAVLFFSFGHVHALVYRFLIDLDWDTASQFDVPHFVLRHDTMWELAALWLVLLLWGAWSILDGEEKRRKRLCGFLNVLSVALVGVSLLWAISGRVNASSATAAIAGSRASATAAARMPENRPDIYYIILDGFAREDVFREHYDHDLGWFTDRLRAKGFTVVPRSRANYEWTFLSLASSLNMDYVDSLVDELGRRSRDRRRAYAMIRDNRVSQYLHTLGYRTVHLNSTWGGTMTNPFADIEIGCRRGVFQVEFYRVLLESTVLALVDTRVTDDLAQCHLHNLEQLRQMGSMRGPKFVFCHFVPPHHPYLFDRDGNVLRNVTVSNQFQLQKRLWADRKSYLDQAVFMGRSIDGVVENILRESRVPPIIIIQSDHGPDIAGSDHHRARLASFLAVHLPGGAELLPPDETPVNLFPRIFNHYFQADLPIREAKHYASSYNAPYAFRKMTFDQ
ncbi:MAG: hypothetical protein JW888_06360 [Pirellulales bacterium]|nr:hypothetical protein [Pirellulales bacterium]